MAKTPLDTAYDAILSPAEQKLAAAVEANNRDLAVIANIEKAHLDAQTARVRDRAESPNAVVSDTDLSTFTGQLTNLAISAGAITTSVLGDVIQAPAKLWRENELASANITQEDIDNYWSLKNKQVQEAAGMNLLEDYTEAEKALTKPNIGKTRGIGTYMTTHDAPSKAQTLDAFFEGEKDAQVSRTYVYDAVSRYVNNLKKNEVMADSKKTYEENKKDVVQGFEELRKGDLAGIGKMVSAVDKMGSEGLATLFTNPSGTAQLAVEAIPTAIMAAISAPLSVAAYGTSYIRDAEDMYRREYKKMPLGTDRAIMVSGSMLAGAVGTYADRLLGSAVVNSIGGNITKAAGEAAEAVAQGGLKEGAKKVTQELVDTALGIAATATKEGITEATEQAIVEYSGKQDIDKMDGAEIFANGVAGFGAGGMLDGGAAAVGKVNDFAKSAKASIVAKEATKTVLAADAKADEATSEQGVVNPEVRKGADLSSSLGIAKVLRNARTVLEKDETDQGTREDTILFAKHALSSIDNRLDATAEKLLDVEDMSKVEGISEDAKELLNSTKNELLKEQKRLQKIKDENAEKITAEYDALVSNPEVYEAAKSRLTTEKLDELADMDTQEVPLDEESDTTETDTTPTVDNTLDKDAALLAASSLVTDKVTPEDLEAAANSPKISPQRATQLKETAILNRLIDVAKSSAMVAKDIIEGGEGFVGIKQYQQRITEHLNSGSLRTAARDLTSLGKFAAHHEAKAKAYEAALVQAQNAPKGTRIEVVGFRTLPTKTNPKGNPVTLDANAGKLVNSVRQEADLVKSAFTSLANQVTAFMPKQTTAKPETAPKTEAPKAEPVVQETVNKTEPEAKPEEKTSEPETVSEPTASVQEQTVQEQVVEEQVVEEQVTEEQEDTSTNPITKSVNQGSRAGLKPEHLVNEADAQHLMTNPVSLFKRIKRGVLWTINYRDTNAVMEALNRELTPSESLLLDKLPVFMGGFEARLRSLLPSPETVLSKRGWQSVSAPLHAFTLEDGTFSKEFIEAMAISALEYLESNSLSLMGDNTTSIATLLGLDTKDFVPTREQYEALGNAGSPYADVAQKLGAIALKNMGMKKDSSKPQNIMNNMEYDLGRAIIGALNGTTRENGILTVTSYKISDLVALGGDYNIDPKNPHATIESIAFNPKVVASFLGVKDVSSIFGGTNGLLTTLTSNKAELPKAEIGTKTQKVSNIIRRSKGQKAPKEFVEGLQKDANVPNYLDLNMHTLFNELGKNWFAYMLGTRDASKAIRGKRPSIEGKNKTAEVDISRYEMFISRMQETAGNLTAPFFYNYRIGKQLRASAIGSDINFQTSKFHRYMTAMEPSEIDMVNNTNHSFTLFKLGVVQGLGFGVDKKTIQASLAFYDSVLADPIFMNGVYAIKEILTGTPVTDGHRQAILDAVEKGEEATHSLKSLTGLAEMLMATEGKFNTTVTLELDGVTNGVANAHIQMGLAMQNGKLTETSRIRLAQSGFFLDGTETYNEWINRAGNMDMYQSTVVAANVAEQVWIDDATNQDMIGILATFKKYTGELVKETIEGELAATSEGRNFVKNSITTTVYASGAKSRSDKMADKVMDNLLDAVEKAVLAKDVQALNELKQDISTLAGMRIIFPRNMMEFEFNSFIAKGIKYSFSKSLGAIVNEAISNEYAKQLDNTALVTETSNVIFDMFNALYQTKIKEKLTELRTSGKLSKYAYLSEDQLDDIKNSLLHTMPVFNSFYGNIRNGVMTAKYSGISNVSNADKDVKAAFHLGSALGHRGSNYSYTDGYEAPAAGTMAILNIAFGDATTMARAAYKSDEPLGLNVFDARLTRIANVANTATALNESAYEAVTYHNLLGTVNKRLQEATKEFMQSGVSKTYSPEINALAHKVLVAHYSDELSLINGKAHYRHTHTGGSPVPLEDAEVAESFTPDMLVRYIDNLNARMAAAHKQSQEAKQVLYKSLSVNQFSSVTGGAKFANGKKQDVRDFTMEEAANAQASLETRIIETVMDSTEPLTGDIDQTLANLEAALPSIENTPVANQVTGHFVNGAIPAALAARLNKFDKEYTRITNNNLEEDISVPPVTIAEMLTLISNAAENEVGLNERTLAKELLKLLDPQVAEEYVFFQGTGVGKEEYAGKYREGYGIELNPATLSLQVLLHEAVHAVTIKISNALNPALNAEIKALQDYVLKYIADNKLDTSRRYGESASLFYGLSAEEEFAPEVLTNAALQEMLKQIPYKSTNVFNAFGKWLRRALNLPQNSQTAFDKAIEIVERSFDKTPSVATVEPKLEAIIAGRTEFPLADILNNLKDLTDIRTAKAMRELLSNLRGSNIQVRILGANEQKVIATSLGEMSTESLYGYWEPNEKVIYLQGTHSPNSGVAIETLLHEAIHAALDSRLSSIEKQLNQGVNGGHTAKELSAYKHIEQMRAKAKEFLDVDSTANIKEFIAWGLSNAKNRGLLSKQPTRIRAFVKAIVTQLKLMLGLKTQDSNMLLDLLADAMVIGKAGTEVRSSLDNTVASSPQVAHDATRYMDLNQIYDHIAKSNTNTITASHDAHLREVLNKAVIKAINPTLLVIPDNAKTLSSQDAALLHAIDPDIRKDFGLLTALNFRVSDQELMVYATYSTIIGSALNDFGWNTREIRRMYAHAKKNLSWRDFIGQDSVLDTEADRARSESEARARYNAVFANTQTNDYLRNFMALAATNEAFRERLATLPTPPAVSKAIRGETVRDTLKNIVEAILNFLNDLAITRSHEPTVLAKLDKLAKNIRHREIKEKNKLQSKIIKSAKFASKVLNTVNEFSRIKIDKAFDKMKKKVSKRRILNAAVTLSSVVLSERRASEFALGLDTIQNFMTTGREGFVSALWTDLKGTDDSNIRIHSLLAMKNKLIDQETVNVKTNTSELVKSLFGKELTDKESVAATKVLLDSDLSSLLPNGYSFAQIGNFLNNPLAVKNEVTKLQVAIRQQAPKGTDEYFINQAKNTAHMMIRGYQKYRGHVMNNAATIVTLFGTGEPNPNASTQVRAMVDSLITLEALQLVDPVQVQMMGNLYKSEAARKSENGIESILAMHNVVKDKALKNIFLGNEFNYVKGHTTDITDPYMSIQIAPNSMEKELLMQNYERVGEPLVKDKHDPVSEPMYMYVSNYGGEATYLQGAMSLASKGARGMSVLDANNQAGNALPIYKQKDLINKIRKGKAIDNQKLFMPNPPLADNELVPTFDSKGQVIDYRYIMKQEVKDTLLRRDNRVDQVFGAMSASTTVKKNTVTVNSALMKALYDQYSHDRKNNNVRGYLLVEPNAKDKQLAEIWNLMPQEAQKEATALFGREGVYVRKDVINAAFGYRKWTIANLWNPDNDYPEIVKNALYQFITSIYGKTLAKYLMMGERGLQEIVKEAKDIIVIKSVVVLASNFMSNTAQLFLFHDVNPIKAVSDQITAITAAQEYNKNAKEIFFLQAKVDANIATSAMRLRLHELVQDQARNPVKGLIDAGMLQTIVDDASAQEDLYSFKHGLIGKLEEVTSAIPDGVKEAFKQVTFQQGSIAYDFLRKATQFSDFAARYALYNHQVNNEGVSHDIAIQNIMDAFVNYDLPPHKAMQYTNDMGITWFFKYFIRMQKVIVKSFRKNPAKVLSLSVGADMLGVNIPTPLDAFAPFVDVNRKIGLIDGFSMAANALPLAKVF